MYYAGVTPHLTPEGKVVLIVDQVTNKYQISAELEIRDADREINSRPRHAHDHAHSLLSSENHTIILPRVGGLKFETDYSIYALLIPVIRSAYEDEKCPIFYFR